MELMESGNPYEPPRTQTEAKRTLLCVATKASASVLIVAAVVFAVNRVIESAVLLNAYMEGGTPLNWSPGNVSEACINVAIAGVVVAAAVVWFTRLGHDVRAK